MEDLPFRSESETITEAEMARTLLTVALSNFVQRSTGIDSVGSLEAMSHCTRGECSYMKAEQWRVEARKLFEVGLAHIQFNLLAIVRGSAKSWGSKHPRDT